MRLRAFLIVLVCAASAAAVDVGELPLALDWRAPSECGGADHVRSQTANLLRVTPPGRWRARARIERVGPEYLMVLEVAGPIRGTRRLRGADCAALAESAALVLALTLGDPAANENADAPADLPEPVASVAVALAEPRPEPPPAPEVSAPRLPETPRGATQARWALRVALGGLLDVGTLPSVAGGGTLRIEIAHPNLRLGVGAFAAGRARADSTADADAFAELAVVGAEAYGCGGATPSWLGVFGCARLEVGQLRGQGHGVDNPQSGGAPWTALGVGLGGTARLAAAWRLGLDVGISIPIAPRDFLLAAEPVHAATVGFRGSVTIVGSLLGDR